MRMRIETDVEELDASYNYYTLWFKMLGVFLKLYFLYEGKT